MKCCTPCIGWRALQKGGSEIDVAGTVGGCAVDFLSTGWRNAICSCSLRTEIKTCAGDADIRTVIPSIFECTQGRTELDTRTARPTTSKTEPGHTSVVIAMYLKLELKHPIFCKSSPACGGQWLLPAGVAVGSNMGAWICFGARICNRCPQLRSCARFRRSGGGRSGGKAVASSGLAQSFANRSLTVYGSRAKWKAMKGFTDGNRERNNSVGVGGSKKHLASFIARSLPPCSFPCTSRTSNSNSCTNY